MERDVMLCSVTRATVRTFDGVGDSAASPVLFRLGGLSSERACAAVRCEHEGRSNVCSDIPWVTHYLYEPANYPVP